jgi:hypothetical protein
MGGPAAETDRTGIPQTERHYLSGRGPSDAVPWGFMVTKGRRKGEATTIPVPSNWEQHGFGTYEYGQDERRSADEHGLYRLQFAVPELFKGKRLRIVFDGVMTDATVSLNGRQLGPAHQGGFYRFSHDVTEAVRFGKAANLLEIDVSKRSANAATEKAERGGDYWVFGGIFRPVWIEATPREAIASVAVDARADGALSATVSIEGDERADSVEARLEGPSGEPVGVPIVARVPAGGSGRLTLSRRFPGVQTWTSETPRLHRLHLTLFGGGRPLHRVTTRIGFRTFETRPGEGLFLNGRRILLKGVNRHAFRPGTARALNPSDSWDDVRLIKSMNMNAVRMSHYPPDEALLEAADELGLYVIDELSGWHHSHDTQVGRLLVRAMVERDVNHPSILFWTNGNEGGWNRDLDGEYALWDPQKRRVLHPWELHDDVDTKHYPDHADLTRRLAGPHLVMPTEMIHALYDGGGAAGLADYWRAIRTSPVGAGGFLWAFADEGVARSDRGGAIDTFGTYAPDGLVGPFHEKEASYFAVRDIWAPIAVEPPTLRPAFDGRLTVRNEHEFVTLDDVRFDWQLRVFESLAGKRGRTLAQGAARARGIAPGQSGTLSLDLPRQWRTADALELTAQRGGRVVRSWSWPIGGGDAAAQPAAERRPTIDRSGGDVVLRAGPLSITIDGVTAMPRRVEKAGKPLSFGGRPMLDWARPDDGRSAEWTKLGAGLQAGGRALDFAAGRAARQNLVEMELEFAKGDSYADFAIALRDGKGGWTTIFDGPRRPGDGVRYLFAPQIVTAVRVTGLTRSDGTPIAIKSIRAGHQSARFPVDEATRLMDARIVEREGATVAEVTATGGGFDTLTWTLHGDGALTLLYRYALDGPMLYHGVSMVQSLHRIARTRRLTEGPHPVWRNRTEGVTLGVYAGGTPNAATPQDIGYFSGFRWLDLATADGDWSVERLSGPDLLRIGSRRANHGYTSVEFPRGDISFLHAIPAMGSKFVKPEDSGPNGEPEIAKGSYAGTLRFRFQSSTGLPESARSSQPQ